MPKKLADIARHDQSRSPTKKALRGTTIREAPIWLAVFPGHALWESWEGEASLAPPAAY